MFDGSFGSKDSWYRLSHHLRIKAKLYFLLSWRCHIVRVFVILVQVFVQNSDKIPIVIEFLLAKSDRFDLYIDFQLRHSTLCSLEIQYILILALRSPDDSIDEHDSWKIMIENAAVDDSLPKLLDFESEGYIVKYGMNPVIDLLACGCDLWVSRFVHVYELNQQL